jgi:alkylation response protein AidB-like acyl-CoA dehydrogenase
MSVADATLLSRARCAAETIAPFSSRIEAERRLPPEAVRALVDAGVFKLLVPRAFGGSQASAATFLAVLEEVARVDGSAAWCSMIGVTSSLMSVFVDESVAREVYSAPDAITCGVFAPMGRATPVEGGFRVSGRWPFASGCEHSSWRMGGAIVAGDTPDLLPSGAPNVRSMLFRAEDTRIVDTWDTSGLRGTGSHDLEVKDVFVPTSRSFSLLSDRPRHAGYELPFFGLLAAGVAAVALGLGRGAVDTFIDQANKKTPPGSKRTVAHREIVQIQVAQAEARLRAARAFLFDSLAQAEGECARSGEASLRTRALLRLAATHAATESAAAVDIAYKGAGASAVYVKNPLQRYFRDVHVATQHLMVNGTSDALAGRVLLGLDADATTL